MAAGWRLRRFGMFRCPMARSGECPHLRQSAPRWATNPPHHSQVARSSETAATLAGLALGRAEVALLPLAKLALLAGLGLSLRPLIVGHHLLAAWASRETDRQPLPGNADR